MLYYHNFFEDFQRNKANSDFNTKVMAHAMVRGAETAYKAVIKPKEGTILTVAKGAANKAVELANKTDDLIYFSTEVIKHGRSFRRNSRIITCFKEAGVVDSGGQGLLEICIEFS